jgi:2-methylcitrate dehydratase PrpD
MTGDRAAAYLGRFAAEASVPASARGVAKNAWLDTVGVMLAGSVEPSARIAQRLCATEHGSCHVVGASMLASPEAAALANGTAAHALDYDDMCFVSLAHPSAPLVAASLSAGELIGASGRDLLDAYVVGFEIECVLGRTVNPSHYARGWHCTSTLGAIGTAAAAARLLGCGPAEAAHAISIAASTAGGLKENFGTMVKPLHAGLAARNGITAARLAAGGFVASTAAIDGQQGFVAAMSDQRPERITTLVTELGFRWEILDTGVTVKLYPSCAATHPSLDALLDLRRQHRFEADDIELIEVAVDPVTPGVLIYPEPTSGLEAKFSMQFCLAAAAFEGRLGIDSFEPGRVSDPAVRRLASRIVMRVDDELGRAGPALTQAHLHVRLRNGRSLVARANGARGYPDHPASGEEFDTKFRECARRALGDPAIEAVLAALHRFEELADVRVMTSELADGRPVAY